MCFTPSPAILARISHATEQAVSRAQIYLPDDVKTRIIEAARSDSADIARQELTNILENIRLAEERKAPLCQDTGIPIIYVTIPKDVVCPDVSARLLLPSLDLENALLQAASGQLQDLHIHP